MPYCPKCDMEFVEGVTVCTDCGGPLVESREAAQAQKAAEKEKLERRCASGMKRCRRRQKKWKTAGQAAGWYLCEKRAAL